MYDLERVTKEFSDTLEKAGCKLDVPVTINGRLTSTLGRVIYRGNNPYKVEFSKQFLGTSTDDCIYQVILHEAAHFIAAKRSGVCHHHDGYFKQICAEIGCTNDQTKTHVERTVALEKIYKYVVYCPKCGPIAGYQRWSKTLDHLDECSCKSCGSLKLYYTEGEKA